MISPEVPPNFAARFVVWFDYRPQGSVQRTWQIRYLVGRYLAAGWVMPVIQ